MQETTSNGVEYEVDDLDVAAVLVLVQD
ncbi:MAG: hypothetical protein JWO11_800, partial [Nocardioides sp.]|nr:hypothetical protein [Nocardioides sp.]